VGSRFSVVGCGSSVGFRLLTVAFWVGDVVDFSVVCCGFSVVCCGFSVGIRLLTVTFWVGDAVDFSVVCCGFSVVCCELWVVCSELWVLGWDSIAYSGFLGWGCCRVFGFRLSFQLWVVGSRLGFDCLQ
jgi:hypothetical protein